MEVTCRFPWFLSSGTIFEAELILRMLKKKLLIGLIPAFLVLLILFFFLKMQK
jgi:hypothetical protein